MEKEQQSQMQINLDPNLYAISNVSILFGEEEFHFLLTSGAQGRQFTATPKHAKRIYLLLKQQIESYEKQFEEIKTQLPNMPKNSRDETNVGF